MPGIASAVALHLRASDSMWTGLNAAQVTLTNTTLVAGNTATLRFKARWLHGRPEPLLRLAWKLAGSHRAHAGPG